MILSSGLGVGVLMARLRGKGYFGIVFSGILALIRV